MKEKNTRTYEDHDDASLGILLPSFNLLESIKIDYRVERLGGK
jgi:hypothetical protein